MIRTMLASAAALALTAGAANAQTFIYGGDPYVAAVAPPIIVERRAAVIPAPGPVFVEPAPRVVVVPDLMPLPPGALTTPDANDNKRVARAWPRHWRAPVGGVVVYP
jgi:hypothetical protein